MRCGLVACDACEWRKRYEKNYSEDKSKHAVSLEQTGDE